jgi:hypothetical protein
MRELQYRIFADYFQVIFADVTALDLIGVDTYTVDLSNSLVTSTAYFTINTLRNYAVDVAVNVLTAKPDGSTLGCDIHEVGTFECRSGTVAVLSPTSYRGALDRFDLPKGPYHVQLCVRNPRSIDERQTHGEEVYEISFWPRLN